MYRTILCAAAALFITSQTEAQTPAPIFACVNNSGGTIDVITPNVRCVNNEIMLTRNIFAP